jgi:hypothetical protein
MSCFPHVELQFVVVFGGRMGEIKHPEGPQTLFAATRVHGIGVARSAAQRCAALPVEQVPDKRPLMPASATCTDSRAGRYSMSSACSLLVQLDRG